MSFLFRKPASKHIDLDKFGKCLDKLCESHELPESEMSLRKGVFQNFEKISQLYTMGWTFEKICDRLRQDLNIDFSTSSFQRYFWEARKERQKVMVPQTMPAAGDAFEKPSAETLETIASDETDVIKKCWRALAELKEQGPSENGFSLRQFVFESYPIIQDLLDKGMTSGKIANHLKNTLQTDFSDLTFANYVSQAKRRAENQIAGENA